MEQQLTLQRAPCETEGSTIAVPTAITMGNDSDQNLESRSFTTTRHITTCLLARKANSATTERHFCSTKLLSFFLPSILMWVSVFS